MQCWWEERRGQRDLAPLCAHLRQAERDRQALHQRGGGHPIHSGSFTPQTGYDLYFGHAQGQSQPLGGLLDEISLYNRALDGQEVLGVLPSGADGKCPIDDNAAPVINAGPDQSLAQSTDTTTLHGTVSDDGLPLEMSVSVEWSKLFGPGEVEFGDPYAIETTASFTVPGIYVLKVLAHDGLDEASDAMEVRVAAFCMVESSERLVAWWPGNGDAKDIVSEQSRTSA